MEWGGNWTGRGLKEGQGGEEGKDPGLLGGMENEGQGNSPEPLEPGLIILQEVRKQRGS